MNCSKFFTFAAIMATALFTANKASAVPGLVNISATATFEQDTVVTTGSDTFKTVKESFKTKDALALLQTAVGNSFPDDDVSWFTASGSALVYDPDVPNIEASQQYDGSDNSVFGIFWVTNSTTHQGFRLDGLDGSENYFSFIELDFAPWFLGFSAVGEFNLNGVFSGKYVTAPYQYASKITGNATLYIHDNPYDFDYPDFLDTVVSDNNFAVVLTGPTTYSFSYKFDSKSNLYPAKNSVSIKGSGDGMWNDAAIQPVFSGSVKSSGSGKETEDEALFPDPLGTD